MCEKLERCCDCDDPTGRAGLAEDSVACELCEAEPLCRDCERRHQAEHLAGPQLAAALAVLRAAAERFETDMCQARRQAVHHMAAAGRRFLAAFRGWKTTAADDFPLDRTAADKMAVAIAEVVDSLFYLRPCLKPELIEIQNAATEARLEYLEHPPVREEDFEVRDDACPREMLAALRGGVVSLKQAGAFDPPLITRELAHCEACGPEVQLSVVHAMDAGETTGGPS